MVLLQVLVGIILTIGTGIDMAMLLRKRNKTMLKAAAAVAMPSENEADFGAKHACVKKRKGKGREG